MKKLFKSITCLSLTFGLLPMSSTIAATNTNTSFYVPSQQINDAINVQVSNQQKINPKMAPATNDSIVRINIAAGSEKQEWMMAAVRSFVQDKRNVLESGKKIDIVITPMGSIDAAEQILKGNTTFQVWSPATSVFKDYVSSGFTTSNFATDRPLVSSPMVFATYSDTAQGIDSKVKKPMSFNTIAEVFDKEFNNAYSVDNGPSYTYNPQRQFRFDMTKPEKSNSGLGALIVMAYEYLSQVKKIRKLSVNDLNNKDLQSYLAFIKGSISLKTASTGDLANTLAGQIRSLDSAWIYENTAIEVIRSIKSRDPNAKNIKIQYPQFNIVADHPYYTLINGSTQDQIDASRKFMEYLLEKKQQLLALNAYGFRPVSAEITSTELNNAFNGATQFGFDANFTNQSQIILQQSADVIRGLIYLFKTIQPI